MSRSRILVVMVLPALMTASGCLATKADIRLIQDDLRSSRSASASSDAAQRAQADSIAKASEKAAAANTARLDAMIRAMGDSIRMLRKIVDANQASDRDFKLSMRDSLREMSRDLSQVKALAETFPSIGKNMKAVLEAQQATIDSLNAKIMRMGASPMMGASPGDTTSGSPGSPVSSGVPGPATLQQQGVISLSNQSYSTARRSFQALIDNYPTDPLVPETYMYIGRSYAEERNTSAADSVYRLVVDRYPQSSVSGTALYKRGVLLEPKNPTLAKTLFQQVLSDYPNSESYPLACAKIRTKC